MEPPAVVGRLEFYSPFQPPPFCPDIRQCRNPIVRKPGSVARVCIFQSQCSVARVSPRERVREKIRERRLERADQREQIREKTREKDRESLTPIQSVS